MYPPIHLIITGFDYVLTDNASLNKTWEQFEAPVISYSTIQSEGFGMPTRYRGLKMMLTLSFVTQNCQ